MNLIKRFIQRTLQIFFGVRFVDKKLKKVEMSRAELARDRDEYARLNNDDRFIIKSEHDFICRGDKYAPNANVDNNYFVQDIWGARKVFLNKPKIHFDTGSSVAGFIAHLLSFHQKIVLIDIREMKNGLNTEFIQNGGGGIEYICADVTNLSSIPPNSIESLSALCSVEHFGLGRYGDKIEPDAWQKALKFFECVIKPQGRLYISVPVGKTDKVCFNAHRVFRPETIIEAFSQMDIVEMSYVSGFDAIKCMEWENGELRIYRDKLDSIVEYKNWGDFGLFEFVKR